MAKVSNRALDLIEIGLSGPSAAAAGRAFFHALRPFGANAIYARAYGLGEDPTGLGHIYSRISPPESGWESLYSEKRFQDANHLVRALPRRATPYTWSEVIPATAAERAFSGALTECGFPDGLAIPCHGPNGYRAIVSLAFERLGDVDPSDRAAIQIASQVLHDRMRALTDPAKLPGHKPLSRRERDCLAFIAEGRTDPEIADLIGLAQSTVALHVKNARLKLGAKTRAQAVAHYLLSAVT